MRRFALGTGTHGASDGGQSAAAQNEDLPAIEIAGGYSLLRSATASTAFNLQGGSASVAANVNDWLGVVGDFGYYRNKSFSPAGFGLNIASYMFGPRYSYRGFAALHAVRAATGRSRPRRRHAVHAGFRVGQRFPRSGERLGHGHRGGVDYNLTRISGRARSPGGMAVHHFPQRRLKPSAQSAADASARCSASGAELALM